MSRFSVLYSSEFQFSQSSDTVHSYSSLEYSYTVQFNTVQYIPWHCSEKNVPTNKLITLINVSVPCVVVADLLDKEYRPLPRDGVGATHGLPSITVQTGEWHTVLNRSVGNGTKKRWASTADAHNANPLREEDEHE